ncbi:MAG: hypothetical protein ACFFDO_05390 [Candidatus Thorarchaeota archaeon]
MANSDESIQEEIIKLVRNLDNKMDEFSKILQKFGLNIITQFGKTTHNLRILTDKIDNLDKATIKIKGLAPQLIKIIDNQNAIETELGLLKSLIQRIKPQKEIESESIEKDVSIIEIRQLILDQFAELMLEIDNMDDIQLITTNLDTIKHRIFESLGGHKIPYEISQVINKLNNAKSLTEDLKNNLKEKIGLWINRL